MGSWGFVLDHALLYQNGSDSLRNEQDSEIMLSFRVGNTFATTSILTLGMVGRTRLWIFKIFLVETADHILIKPLCISLLDRLFSHPTARI